MSGPGRVKRGLKHHNCAPCASGFVPGRPKTFDPLCERCQEKKVQGLRTGLEPLPQKPGNAAKRIDRAKFLARIESETAGRKREENRA